MLSVEENIRRAMKEGKFDDLPGKGKPLKLEDNPHEDADWRMAHHILQSNGFTLPWIEKLHEIEADLEAAERALMRAWAWRQESQLDEHSPACVEKEWRKAVIRFGEQVKVLNKRIFSYNLEVPLERFQKVTIHADRLLERLTASALSDKL